MIHNLQSSDQFQGWLRTAEFLTDLAELCSAQKMTVTELDFLAVEGYPKTDLQTAFCDLL